MTIKDITWAMEDAPIDNPQQLAVLIVLADRAMDGTHAWPSHDYIAYRARMSPRSVQRILTELEEVGVIRRCNNPHHGVRMSKIPMGRRPILWALNTKAIREQPSFEADPDDECGWTISDNGLQGGVTEETPRGDTCGGRVPNTIPNREPNKYTQEFEDEFWPLFPRKLSKAKARKLFVAARASVPLEDILKGVTAYVKETKDTEPKYIKHPTTWLSQECWNDVYESSTPSLTSTQFDLLVSNDDFQSLFDLSDVKRPSFPDFGDIGVRETRIKEKEFLHAWVLENKSLFLS